MLQLRTTRLVHHHGWVGFAGRPSRRAGSGDAGETPSRWPDRDDTSGVDAELDIAHEAVIERFGTDRTAPSVPQDGGCPRSALSQPYARWKGNSLEIRNPRSARQ